MDPLTALQVWRQRRAELAKTAARIALRLQEPSMVGALHVLDPGELVLLPDLQAGAPFIHPLSLPSPASHWPWSPSDEQRTKWLGYITAAGA